MAWAGQAGVRAWRRVIAATIWRAQGLKAADRNVEVMRPYLEAAAAAGRSQVAAIGVAQETQRVFIARKRDTDPGKCPQFSFDKKDRRVTVYYFYLWDAGFGPYADRLDMPRVVSENSAEQPLWR
jgi:hypothetical protein